MSKFPANTPKAIREAAHKQKMMGKHFRRMERGTTEADAEFVRKHGDKI